MTAKECRCCKQTKPATEFTRDKSRKDGLRIYCIECGRKKNREAWDPAKGHERYMANRKARTEYARTRLASLTDEQNADRLQKRRARERVSEKAKAGKERYKANHPEKAKEAMRVANKAARDALSDSYLRDLLKEGTKLKAHEIPQSIVELKRAQMTLKRELRDEK